jgi:hypothetical protein
VRDHERAAAVPPGVDAAASYRVRAAGFVLDANVDWSEAVADWINGAEVAAPILR